MKIILSRKGFDSSCGGMPSPILPDGTLLSIPIPSKDKITYSDINWNNHSYLDIIKELNPRSLINESSRCHLDPDLREPTYKRNHGWMPAFGQTGSSLTELYDNGVGIGDLFLFFGWFKETELFNGHLRFKKRAPNIHAIYGYLQVGNIISLIDDVPSWLSYHTHANPEKYAKAWLEGHNAIFTPVQRLSFANHLAGSGTFRFSPQVTLTKQGYCRSRWEFPETMRGIEISHNPRGWKQDYFQSAARGQEFIFDCNQAVMDWLKSIFQI